MNRPHIMERFANKCHGPSKESGEKFYGVGNVRYSGGGRSWRERRGMVDASCENTT